METLRTSDVWLRLLLLTLVVVAVSAVQKAPRVLKFNGEDDVRQGNMRHLLGKDRRMLEGFDPTVKSGSDCSPKTYPKGDDPLDPVSFDTAITDVRWAHSKPYEDKSVYVLLESESGFGGGRVFMSRDYGKGGTWDDITKHMDGAFKSDSEFFELSGVYEMHFHPDQPSKILFQGAGMKNWIQDGSEAKFEAVDTPGKTVGYGAEIKMHPTKTEYLLAKVRRNHCLTHGIDRWCAYDVFVSTDFGRSWANLTANSKGNIASFIDFDWGARARRSDSKTNMPDETIFATVYEKMEHMPSTGPFSHGWDPNVHFVVSHDFFKNAHKKLVSCGNMFEIVAHKVFIALPSQCPTGPDGGKREVSPEASSSLVNLYVSDDEGAHFNKVCLPVTIEDKGYNIVRTYDGEGVFLVVDHDEEDALAATAPVGNVYANGYNHSAIFTLSMQRNFRRNFVVDFVRVEGMPGMYLANQLDDVVTTAGGAMSKEIKLDKFVKTKVSFNGGAKWQDVELPRHFRHVECNNCAGTSQECKLHLHGPSSWFWTPDMKPSPSLYSHENAPGFVMATGNTGRYLDTTGETSCTWLSEDGGVTWVDIANHAAIYEFGDHGAVVLVAPFMTSHPTDKVFFSGDNGQCWNTIKLKEAIFVENIRVEPRGASHIFMVHGTACYKDEHESCHTEQGLDRQGKLYQVDLRDLRGDEWSKCLDEEYTDWSPPQPEICLLGGNYTIQRRKAGHYCFNDREYDRPGYRVTPCPCNDADTECEFGYEPDSKGKCQKMEGIDMDICPTLKNGGYKVSSTDLRLIHGDMCLGMENILKDSDGKGHSVHWDKSGHASPVPNPGESSSSGHSWWYWIGVALLGALCILGVCGGCMWWRYFASEYTKSSVEDCLEPLMKCCSGLTDSIKGTVSGVVHRREAQDAFFQPLAGPEGLELRVEDSQSPAIIGTTGSNRV